MKNREGGNILVIIIGIVLLLFIIGFFRSEKSFWGTFNYKTILRLPCGITVKSPSYGKDEKVSFPIKVNGYVNGCGWDVEDTSVGTAQIFDGRGLPVTKPVPLVVPDDSKEEPFYFEATLLPISAPSTDVGNILITSTTGLLHPIGIKF